MEKCSWELQAGDIMAFVWCGPKMIVGFKEYTGPIDFVERVAVFHDGSRMSLEKGRMYSVLGPGQTGGICTK